MIFQPTSFDRHFLRELGIKPILKPVYIEDSPSALHGLMEDANAIANTGRRCGADAHHDPED